MKKLCAAAIALTVLAGAVDAHPKIDRETIIVSTQDSSVGGDDWVVTFLTFIVLILALGSGASGIPSPS